jgi:hypothetical protein
MSGYLESVRDELAAGSVAPRSLVLLYRAAEEAEQSGDVRELEACVELARQAAAAGDHLLRDEAERLVALCEERLERVRPGDPVAGDEPAACPGCGRSLPATAVRCRACGTLLV